MDKASYEIRIKQWIGVIQEANASGMTKCSWCEQSGISPRQFYYWQKKVRDYALAQTIPPSTVGHHDTPPSPAGKERDLPVFCELPAPTEPRQLSPFNGQCTVNTTFMPELVLQCDRFKLLIGNSINEKTLATVLSVLGHV